MSSGDRDSYYKAFGTKGKTGDPTPMTCLYYLKIVLKIIIMKQ